MPDSRPLTDRQWQVETLRKVVTFLNERGYEEATVKSLQSPPVKVFAAVLQFCFRRIDPGFTFRGQYDEEIPNMFRMLEYPMPIAKNELKVIAPQQWPKLLAALSWLVDLLMYDEKVVDVQAEAGQLETDDADGVFFEYLRHGYELFLEGVDETPELDQEFTAQFEDKNRQIEEECKELERTNTGLQRDIAKLEQEAARLPTLRSRKAALVSDARKLTDHVASLEEHQAEVERKVVDKEADLTGKKKRLEMLVKEKNVLQTRLTAQEASGEDFGKMMQEQRDLELAVVQLREARDTATKMRGEHEIALQKLLETVEGELRHYNELCMRLRLLPQSANTKMPDVNFDLQFKSHAPAEEMIAADMSATVKPALKALRSKVAQANRVAGSDLLQLKEELDRTQEQTEAKRDDVGKLKNKVEQQEHEVQSVKEAGDQEETHLKQKAKTVREETETLVKRAAAKLQSSQVAVDKLQTQQHVAKKRFTEQAQETDNSIIDVIDRLTGHKQYIQQRLRELSDLAETTALELAAAETAWKKAHNQMA